MTPEVNPVTFETRFVAVFWTPFTTEAAAVAPGSEGMDIVRLPPDGAETLVDGILGRGVDGA